MEYYPMKFRRRWISPLALVTLSSHVTTKLCSGVVLIICLFPLAIAQQPAASGANSSTPSAAGASTTASVEKASSTERSNDRYRIGPGDLLDIRVFNKPQFSRDAVRVDACGIIRMPFIESDIQAAGRTESELSSVIKELLREYLTRPQVDVFIKEYQSQHVAVIGAVRAPSRFQLQRRVRLLDLLSYANGPADSAGRSVQIVHTSAPSSCEADGTNNETEVSSVDYYKLSDTLRGDEKANPYVKGGDIVSIAEADQVYIVGNVMRPSALPLKEPITISRAIAMVGGALPDSKKDKVRIVRQSPGSTAKTEMFVDLKAIDKHQAEDVELLANDIVEVQTNSGKRLLKSFIGAIVPSVAQLPVRVVP
jgi:polysaccharide biosynthesis/export protein